ncbi:hypothetical protein TgHK011_002293 [Trichoderma gracile]|nr:hypothetical protein TgHK011_002293 [Trichoderma gracile]
MTRLDYDSKAVVEGRQTTGKSRDSGLGNCTTWQRLKRPRVYTYTYDAWSSAAHQQQAAMSLPLRGKVHFVYLTDPVKGSAISSHRAAKSHAARHGHARIRRQRMNEYQQERNKHEGDSQVPPTAATPRASSASLSRPGLAGDSQPKSQNNGEGTGTNSEIVLQFARTPQPSTLEHSPLSSVSKNIESLYGTRVNRTQQFLIHHYGNIRYVQLATYYKLVCLRSMSEMLAVQNPLLNDSAIAQLNLGDRDVSRQHIEAANRMVAMQGGSAMLGMNGFLAAIVDTLTCALARRDPMSCDMP